MIRVKIYINGCEIDQICAINVTGDGRSSEKSHLYDVYQVTFHDRGNGPIPFNRKLGQIRYHKNHHHSELVQKMYKLVEKDHARTRNANK